MSQEKAGAPDISTKDISKKEPLLEVKHLKKYFQLSRRDVLKAVDDISFTIYKGETYGLVGESGCGKSTTGSTILRLHEPTGGQILYRGKDITTLSRKEQKAYTKKVQMIFQDPYASLNPRMTIGDSIKEGMRIHHMGSEKQIDDRMHELLDMVGLNREHASRFPYEFSGGQRQRVGIARALAVDPEFIVCDEPISALDVSIQAQIVNLLKKLQRELNLTYLFIAHDLSMVRYISDRVGVMYLGSLLEEADSEELYAKPLHPYTRGLLSAIPDPDPEEKPVCSSSILSGEVTSPVNPGEGCRFRARCPFAIEDCAAVHPELQMITPGHRTACLRTKELVETDYGKFDPECFFCDVRKEAGENLNRIRNKNSILYDRKKEQEKEIEILGKK